MTAASAVAPFACAIHAAERARIEPGQTVLVAGAGTVGILTLLAVRLFSQPGRVIVAAKHPNQRAAATLAGVSVSSMLGRGTRRTGGPLVKTQTLVRPELGLVVSLGLLRRG